MLESMIFSSAYFVKIPSATFLKEELDDPLYTKGLTTITKQ